MQQGGVPRSDRGNPRGRNAYLVGPGAPCRPHRPSGGIDSVDSVYVYDEVLAAPPASPDSITDSGRAGILASASESRSSLLQAAAPYKALEPESRFGGLALEPVVLLTPRPAAVEVTAETKEHRDEACGPCCSFADGDRFFRAPIGEAPGYALNDDGATAASAARDLTAQLLESARATQPGTILGRTTTQSRPEKPPGTTDANIYPVRAVPSGAVSWQRPAAMITRSPACVARPRSSVGSQKHVSERPRGSTPGLPPKKLVRHSSESSSARLRPAQTQGKITEKVGALAVAGKLILSAAHQSDCRVSEKSCYLVTEFRESEASNLALGKWFDKHLKVEYEIAKRVCLIRWFQTKRDVSETRLNLFVYLDSDGQELERKQIGSYC
jgi:hypothetical protein